MIKPLVDVFRMSMLNRPDGSRKEARDHFIAQIKSDPTYLEMLACDYFDRRAATMPLRKTETGYTFQRAGTEAVSIEEVRRKRKASAKRSATMYGEIKAKFRSMVLLDLTLPDGKPLRHATGAECKKAGGFISEVGRHLKGTQVVDKHMTEANLQDMRARFYQTNTAARRRA